MIEKTPALSPALIQPFSSRANLSPNPHTALKLLSDRDQYTSCHIRVPDDPERLSAVVIDAQYYSFFRNMPKADKAIILATKLGQRGDRVALSYSKRGYLLWVYEPDAVPSPPPFAKMRPVRPTFGPPDCLLIWSPSDWQPCRIRTTDYPEPLGAVQYGNSFYSLYRRVDDPAEALNLSMKLAKRGDEVAIAPGNQGYGVCLWEPTATLAL